MGELRLRRHHSSFCQDFLGGFLHLLFQHLLLLCDGSSSELLFGCGLHMPTPPDTPI